MVIVAAKESSQIISVPFYGADLYIAIYRGKPYVSMRRITEGMGLSWASQHTKLTTHFQRGIEKIPIPTKHGVREACCLALDNLSDWLVTINSNKVNLAARKNVIRYQEECHEVLQAHWVANRAKRKEQPLIVRYLIKMEIYDHYRKKTDKFTAGAETPESIIRGVARQFGYSIEKLVSLSPITR